MIVADVSRAAGTVEVTLRGDPDKVREALGLDLAPPSEILQELYDSWKSDPITDEWGPDVFMYDLLQRIDQLRKKDK